MSAESYRDYPDQAYAQLAHNYRLLTRTDFRRAVGSGIGTAALGAGALFAPLMEQGQHGFVAAAALGATAIILGRVTHDLVDVYQDDKVTAEFYEDMSRFGHFEA